MSKKKDNLIKFEIALRGLNVNLDQVIGELIYECMLRIEKGEDIVPEWMMTSHTKIFNRRVAIQQQKIITLLKPLTDKPEKLSEKIARLMMGQTIEEDEGTTKGEGPGPDPKGSS